MTVIDRPDLAASSQDADAKRTWLESHEEGYEKSLKPRQVQMIAIGGAIGTGLFLGAGERLQVAGPALAIVYLVCGIFSFLILRALGELVMYRPTSGSFVSYAREFMGERASFAAGWLYYLSWAMTGIVDITAVALYMNYWGTFANVPQWVFALAAMTFVGGMNMIAVKWFGELEFWFSLIKVAALVAFLIVGTIILGLGHPINGLTPGVHLVSDNGGIFPHGLLPAVIIVQGVVFAYSGIELIGTAAGEAQNAREILPGAVNSVMWRIALFYVGSVLLLVLLMPWTAYKAGVSPFVTFFGALGVPGIGTLMNLVVLTAALSSLNSGLYSTGRVLRSLAMGGSAPPFVAKMNAHKVPYGGILVSLAMYLIGVVLNYLVPSQVFEIVLNVASIGNVSTWGFIVICQMLLRRAQDRGEIAPVAFRMPFAPLSSWLTLGFLLAVFVLMYLIGVVLNYLVPSQVFEIVLNVASIGNVSTWGFIVICQMLLRRAQDRGEIAPVAFRMPFAPLSSWLTLGFLLAVFVLMAFDYPDGTYTIASIPLIAVLLGVGWIIQKGSSPFSPSIPSYLLTHAIETDRDSDPR